MHDTTEIMEPYIEAWKSIGVHIDAIYSGFLGAPEQVSRIRDLYETFPNALRFVDPVMADHGKVYPTYTPELCQAMSDLAADADILTPNLTEAAIILGDPIGDDWAGTDITDAEAQRLIEGLLAKGAKNVVLKGIKREGESVIRNFVAGENLPFTEIHNEYLPYMLHGTGDVYASAVLAAIMAGKSLPVAVEFAGNFTHDAMIVSSKQPEFRARGVSFEPLLGNISELLK
jgi:pyridoxine kinase